MNTDVKGYSTRQGGKWTWGKNTFQCRHAMRQFNFFASGIYSPSLVVQNKRSWLRHLFGFNFPIRKHIINKERKTWFIHFRLQIRDVTYGGAIPIACRLASATRLWGPVFPNAPRIPGFMESWDCMRACSSAALRAFSIASFMKLAALEGAIDDAPLEAEPVCDYWVGKTTANQKSTHLIYFNTQPECDDIYY